MKKITKNLKKKNQKKKEENKNEEFFDFLSKNEQERIEEPKKLEMKKKNESQLSLSSKQSSKEI